MWRIIVYRIYLTAQVLTAVAGAATVVVWGVAFEHDRRVVADDFRCFHEALEHAASQIPDGALPVFTDADEIAAADRCRLTRNVLYYSATSLGNAPWSEWHSTGAWQYHWGKKGGPRFAEEDAAFLGIAIGLPIALFALRRWLRWLLSPSRSSIAGSNNKESGVPE
jgi:hypothetical protein